MDLEYNEVQDIRERIHYLMLLAYRDLLDADLENFYVTHALGASPPPDLVKRFDETNKRVLDDQWIVRRYFRENC